MAKFYEAHRSGNEGFMIAKDRRQYFPPHFHQNIEIFVCLSGSQEITIDGKTFVAEENSVVFIDSFIVHSYGKSEGGKNAVVIIPYYALDKFNAFRKGKILGVFHIKSEGLAKKIMTIIDEDLTEKSSEYTRYSAFNSITSSIIKEFGLMDGEVKSEDELINKILSFIAENFKTNITLKSVSKALGYAEGHISRIFHEYVDEGFCKYVNGLRLEFVERERKITDKKLNELIFDAGFNSIQTYYRAKKENSKYQ